MVWFKLLLTGHHMQILETRYTQIIKLNSRLRQVFEGCRSTLDDFPDQASMVAAELAVNVSGAVTTKISVLITPEEVDEEVGMAVNYQPPGGWCTGCSPGEKLAFLRFGVSHSPIQPPDERFEGLLGGGGVIHLWGPDGHSKQSWILGSRI